MAVRRLSHMKNAQSELTFWQNYLSYYADPTKNQSKRVKGGSVSGTRTLLPCSIQPFSTAAGVGTALSSISSVADGIMAASFGDTASTPRYKTGTTPVGAATRLKGFHAARLNAGYFTGRQANYQQAKATKAYYIKYIGHSYSIPVGASGASEEEKDAASAIVALAKGINPTGGTVTYRRVSYKPEALVVTAK